MNLKFKFFILFFLASTFFHACSQNRKTEWVQPYTFDPSTIRLSIVYEGMLQLNGQDVKSFSLSWNDTFGAKQNYQANNRPYELHVVVRDHDNIVGSYTGLSTQMTHCTFFTNSNSVTVHFWLGPNMFFSENDKQSDTVKYREYFNRKEYAPLKIDLNSQDRHNIIDAYVNKLVTLTYNPKVVQLYHNEKEVLHPDPMPGSSMGLAVGRTKVMALDRYLLDTMTGRILTGKQWIRKYGIAKCAQTGFRVVDPHLTYTDRFGNLCSGKELIRKKRINMDNFKINSFSTLFFSKPYSAGI